MDNLFYLFENRDHVLNHRIHDDLFTCQEIAANQDVNKKKTRIFTERCMEGRGYVILDKDM